MIVLIIIALYFFICNLVAKYGNDTRLGYKKVFIISVLFSPLIGWFVAAMAKDNPDYQGGNNDKED